MVSSADDSRNSSTETPLLSTISSGPISPPKSVMANAINTLLSLRDSVRIKAPWSPQSSTSQTISAALNLGLLSNSASLLRDMDTSPPLLNQSTNSSKNTTPARQDNLRSPRISPQSSNSISPSSSARNHKYSGNSNGLHDDPLLTPSEILDELTYLYPQEDFTLLRKACMKNEITLTKLTRGLAYCYPSTLTPSPGPNSSNGNNNNGSLKDDYMTQQTLQLIKQQNEYVQMLQQSGVNLAVFPSDMTTMAGGLNLSTIADPTSHHSNSKYSSWFHPLAQVAAAAAGINIPSTASTSSSNGNGGSSSKNKNDHLFLSPKTPAALTSTKPKTVAAALAASRHSPSLIGGLVGNGKSKKPVIQRKRQQRQKSSTITRPSLVAMMEDELDPSSMVETTTTIPPDYGMDLSTTMSFNKANDLSSSSSTSNGGKRSKQQYNSQISDMSRMTASPDSSSKSNGHNLLNAASLTLENYLRNVLPNKKSPPNNIDSNNHEANATSSVSTIIAPTLTESDKKKQQVLDAFSDDPEVAGDARGVARKFGLNIRVVLKWLREGPSKSLPALPPLIGGKTNGAINALLDSNLLADLNLHFSNSEQIIMSNGDSHHHGSFSSANNNNNNNNTNNNNNNNNQTKKNLPNKRKNTKPNQICDFQNDDLLPEDEVTVPLDMVVPIKKRRVSNSNASS